MDLNYAFNRIGIKPHTSVTRAISAAGVFFSSFSHPGVGPNKMITWLGGKPIGNPVEADIIAKALLEQAVLLGVENYNFEAAMAVAQQKLAKIRITMPYAFAGSEVNAVNVSKTASKRASPRGGDKKERARVVFDRESGKSDGDIARIIAAELQITYANAYYYVSRVFKK